MGDNLERPADGSQPPSNLRPTAPEFTPQQNPLPRSIPGASYGYPYGYPSSPYGPNPYPSFQTSLNAEAPSFFPTTVASGMLVNAEIPSVESPMHNPDIPTPGHDPRRRFNQPRKRGNKNYQKPRDGNTPTQGANIPHSSPPNTQEKPPPSTAPPEPNEFPSLVSERILNVNETKLPNAWSRPGSQQAGRAPPASEKESVLKQDKELLGAEIATDKQTDVKKPIVDLIKPPKVDVAAATSEAKSDAKATSPKSAPLQEPAVLPPAKKAPGKTWANVLKAADAEPHVPSVKQSKELKEQPPAAPTEPSPVVEPVLAEEPVPTKEPVTKEESAEPLTTEPTTTETTTTTENPSITEQPSSTKEPVHIEPSAFTDSQLPSVPESTSFDSTVCQPRVVNLEPDEKAVEPISSIETTEPADEAVEVKLTKQDERAVEEYEAESTMHRSGEFTLTNTISMKSQDSNLDQQKSVEEESQETTEAVKSLEGQSSSRANDLLNRKYDIDFLFECQAAVEDVDILSRIPQNLLYTGNMWGHIIRIIQANAVHREHPFHSSGGSLWGNSSSSSIRPTMPDSSVPKPKDSLEVIQRKIKMLLNKLNDGNYEKIVQPQQRPLSILDSCSITTNEHIALLIDEVLNKCMEAYEYAEYYTRLLKDVSKNCDRITGYTNEKKETELRRQILKSTQNTFSTKMKYNPPPADIEDHEERHEWNEKERTRIEGLAICLAFCTKFELIRQRILFVEITPTFVDLMSTNPYGASAFCGFVKVIIPAGLLSGTVLQTVCNIIKTRLKDPAHHGLTQAGKFKLMEVDDKIREGVLAPPTTVVKRKLLHRPGPAQRSQDAGPMSSPPLYQHLVQQPPQEDAGGGSWISTGNKKKK